MGEQTQILSLSGGQTYDNHLNNPGDHSYDPLYEADPDVNVLLNENGLLQNSKYFTIDENTAIYKKI